MDTYNQFQKCSVVSAIVMVWMIDLTMVVARASPLEVNAKAIRWIVEGGTEPGKPRSMVHSRDLDLAFHVLGISRKYLSRLHCIRRMQCKCSPWNYLALSLAAKLTGFRCRGSAFALCTEYSVLGHAYNVP